MTNPIATDEFIFPMEDKNILALAEALNVIRSLRAIFCISKHNQTKYALVIDAIDGFLKKYDE